MEKSFAHESRLGRGFIKVGVGIGSIAALAALSGCGALARTFGQQADNPAVREGGEAAARGVDDLLRAGRKSEAELGTAAKGWRVVHAADSQTYTSITTTDAGIGTHQMKLTHSAGTAEDGLTEDEISAIECYVSTVGQMPDGIRELMEGKSYLQRNDTGAWVENIVVSNLKSVATEQELPSVCDVVLSALPGADQ